jgi:hypothetical protein
MCSESVFYRYIDTGFMFLTGLGSVSRLVEREASCVQNRESCDPNDYDAAVNDMLNSIVDSVVQSSMKDNKKSKSAAEYSGNTECLIKQPVYSSVYQLRHTAKRGRRERLSESKCPRREIQLRKNSWIRKVIP